VDNDEVRGEKWNIQKFTGDRWDGKKVRGERVRW
jgi:hypothetical protein